MGEVLATDIEVEDGSKHTGRDYLAKAERDFDGI